MLIGKTDYKDFERVPSGDFVAGEIVEVQEEKEHTFKGFEGAEDKVGPAVRLKFKLNGCEQIHNTRWMKPSTHEKSALYSKYIASLFLGIEPGMEFDTSKLKGLKVKTLWNDKEYQSIETIRPIGDKIDLSGKSKDEEVPF